MSSTRSNTTGTPVKQTGSNWVSDEYHRSMKIGSKPNEEYQKTMRVDKGLVPRDVGLESEALKLLIESSRSKLADATPLGLCGFACTTFILSMMNAGVIVDLRTSSSGVVLGMALAFGGMAQFVAGVMVFSVGNILGGTLFCSYGGFWLSYASLFVDAFGFLDGYTGPDSKRDLDQGLGIYLLSWCIFTILMAICAARTNCVLFSILVLLTITFFCLAVGHFEGNNLEWRRAGGLFGIIISLEAWYMAVAVLLTQENSFFQLPLGHMDDYWEKIGLLPPTANAKKNDDIEEARTDLEEGISVPEDGSERKV